MSKFRKLGSASAKNAEVVSTAVLRLHSHTGCSSSQDFLYFDISGLSAVRRFSPGPMSFIPSCNTVTIYVHKYRSYRALEAPTSLPDRSIIPPHPCSDVG